VKETILATAGLTLLIVVWLSVVRTVFIPRQTSSRAARWTVRALAAISFAVARRLPGRAAGRLLDFSAPLSLFVVMAWWLLGVGLGYSLLAGTVTDAPWARLPGSDTDGYGTGLRFAAWLSFVFVVAASIMYLNRYSDAYARRERPVFRLAVTLPRLADADVALAAWLKSTSRDRVAGNLAMWADWFADIHSTHLSVPALLYSRPAGTLSWPKAAIVAMDAAALVEAVAPNRTPYQARMLLTSGSSCVKRLAAQIGIVLPAATVSLQGREERTFNDTVRLIVSAGLSEERDRHETWASFQRLRSEYAPYAAAIDYRLMHDIDQVRDWDA
jgi:hypothetical protein